MKNERPKWYKFDFSENPRKHFTIASVRPIETDSLYANLRSELAASNDKSILVFVHGYNVSFEDALMRTAQITYDLVYRGAPILYNWPANGKWYDYIADENDGHFTVPHFKEFLQTLSHNTEATEINVIAHSMGCRAFATALTGVSADTNSSITLNQVILAAPDIDADVFRDQLLPQMRSRSNRVTLYASSNDKALSTSRRISKAPRAGEGGKNLFLIKGLDTIDASHDDTDFLGHSIFAQQASILSDIQSILCCSMPPE